MPGAGKTVWGQRLSQHYQWPHVDMDDLIEKAAGKTITRIFEEDGQEVFRQYEQATLLQIIKNVEGPMIVSCGGGTPLFFDNLEQMKDNGCVIYLEAAIDTLWFLVCNDFAKDQWTDAVGTGSNIAASRIADQMKQLNADYGNLTGSTYSQAANTTLQFCLAQKGPSGNILAEPGIDRINRNTKGFTAPPYSRTYVDGTIKAGTYWNPKEYVNIWLLSNPGFTLLGYATFPTGSGLPGLSGTETDQIAGVALLTSAIGSLASPNAGCASTISYGKGRTLTHELGHYFGLRHIWGDNNGDCSLDDFCGDTPRAAASNSGCSKGINTCNDMVYAGAPIDYPDMVENYMDYSDDACMNTFTANQKDRIVAVLTNSPRRKELLTSPAGLYEASILCDYALWGSLFYQSI
ncbi:shikimate kinase [Ostertagia ostertagi]